MPAKAKKPRAKKPRTKKQTISVKGKKNLTNQSNINIKIGTDTKQKSRSSKPRQSQPQKQSGSSNIVVHVAPPNLQNIPAPIFYNKPPEAPLGGAILASTPLGTPPTPAPPAPTPPAPTPPIPPAFGGSYTNSSLGSGASNSNLGGSISDLSSYVPPTPPSSPKYSKSKSKPIFSKPIYRHPIPQSPPKIPSSFFTPDSNDNSNFGNPSIKFIDDYDEPKNILPVDVEDRMLQIEEPDDLSELSSADNTSSLPNNFSFIDMFDNSTQVSSAINPMFQSPQESITSNLSVVPNYSQIDDETIISNVPEDNNYSQIDEPLPVPSNFQTSNESITSNLSNVTPIYSQIDDEPEIEAPISEPELEPEPEIEAPIPTVTEQLISPGDEKVNEPPEIGKYNMAGLDETKGLDEMYENFGNITPHDLKKSHLTGSKNRKMLDEMFVFSARQDPKDYTIKDKIAHVMEAIKHNVYD